MHFTSTLDTPTQTTQRHTYEEPREKTIIVTNSVDRSRDFQGFQDPSQGTTARNAKNSDFLYDAQILLNLFQYHAIRTHRVKLNAFISVKTEPVYNRKSVDRNTIQIYPQKLEPV